MSKRPNILVFLTDDHGQWASSAYGNSEIISPNLDYLAARGTRFTRAFTPTPVCSPARASFYTGRYPSQHGIHDWIQEIDAGKDHPGHDQQTGRYFGRCRWIASLCREKEIGQYGQCAHHYEAGI